MDSPTPARRTLAPLPYHTAVVDYLRLHEPDVWRWANARMTDEQQRESLRTALLRDTYRIDPEAHPEVHARLALAMALLGIAAPATLYQSPGQEMNAALLFVPGEVHIVVQGPLLERMTEPELLAVFGHELAHYLLWSQDDAQDNPMLLAAERILHDAVVSGQASASQRETWRRYSLHTELFADRGGAIAAGNLAPAVSALVKVQTGIGTVDAAAYLRQAAEVDALELSTSDAHTHPETFIRARALALWWEGAPDCDAWIEARLQGPLTLENLDLPGQLRLQALTRGFLAHYLAGADFATEGVLARVRMLFPDWRADEPTLGPEHFGAAVAHDCVRAYLNALMLDLALFDPDTQDAALLRAGQLAESLGSFDALMLSLRRDAAFGKREMDRFKRRLAKETGE